MRIRIYFEEMASVSFKSSLLLFVVAIQACRGTAWLLPGFSEDTDDKSVASAAESNSENLQDTSTLNTDFIEEDVSDVEDAESERDLRCSRDFNKNLFKVLKSFMPNVTDRFGRQEDTDIDALTDSFLNLDFPQIFVPVLKLVSSAAANNATAIDASYNALPLVVRSQVTDLIQFVADVITTT
ncbi:unnamed protein product [Orchesella dallaii]|uniref:Uncharacterized protein n=1 Tax=Orchesella dallaii TaxID=48710 RepID=A0ABP1PKU8_9HEXA